MLWKQTQGLQGWQKIGKDVRNSMKNEGHMVILFTIQKQLLKSYKNIFKVLLFCTLFMIVCHPLKCVFERVEIRLNVWMLELKFKLWTVFYKVLWTLILLFDDFRVLYDASNYVIIIQWPTIIVPLFIKTLCIKMLPVKRGLDWCIHLHDIIFLRSSQ